MKSSRKLGYSIYIYTFIFTAMQHRIFSYNRDGEEHKNCVCMHLYVFM